MDTKEIKCNVVWSTYVLRTALKHFQWSLKIDNPTKNKELQSLLQELRDAKGVFYITSLLSDRDYSKQVYYSWRHSFAGDDQIIELMNKIDDILEDRLIKWMAACKLSKHMVNRITKKGKFGY